MPKGNSSIHTRDHLKKHVLKNTYVVGEKHEVFKHTSLKIWELKKNWVTSDCYHLAHFTPRLPRNVFHMCLWNKIVSCQKENILQLSIAFWSEQFKCNNPRRRIPLEGIRQASAPLIFLCSFVRRDSLLIPALGVKVLAWNSSFPVESGLLNQSPGLTRWLPRYKWCLRSAGGERCSWVEIAWMEAGEIQLLFPTQWGSFHQQALYLSLNFPVCRIFICFKTYKNTCCDDEDIYLQRCTDFSLANQHIGQELRMKDHTVPVVLGLR